MALFPQSSLGERCDLCSCRRHLAISRGASRLVFKACSRLGYVERIDTHLVLAALEMAVNHRQPSEGLIYHTDRDYRYASHVYLDALDHTHMIASMSQKADCWDNAVAESFFATLEKELLDENDYLTREQARASIDTYTEFYYNDRRLQSTLDYVRPLECEMHAA